MARFANPNGLEQRDQNMFANGVNAGIAFSNPGENGAGAIAAGAVELSNSDVGSNLVELVMASTLYRGNTRVINTAQELLDELMNMRR
jgi:flagellar hook protein FlgE